MDNLVGLTTSLLTEGTAYVFYYAYYEVLEKNRRFPDFDYFESFIRRVNHAFCQFRGKEGEHKQFKSLL